MPLVECPRDGCEQRVAVDVDPGNLRKVNVQSNFMGLDSLEVSCNEEHTFYVHH